MAETERLDKEGILWGSGNVFADLGLPDPEVRLAKSQMIHQIDLARQARGLTKAQLAEMVHLEESDLIKLLKGQTRGYSLERLAQFLNALDRDVTITIRERPQGDDRAARTFVEAV